MLIVSKYYVINIMIGKRTKRKVYVPPVVEQPVRVKGSAADVPVGRKRTTTGRGDVPISKKRTPSAQNSKDIPISRKKSGNGRAK